MSRSRTTSVQLAWPTSVAGDLGEPSGTGSRSGGGKWVDAVSCLAAALLGALFLSPAVRDTPDPLPRTDLLVDLLCGGLACLALWWRRRWPSGVAVTCLCLGVVSISATPAGLLSLASLAVHRPARTALLVAGLWLPACIAFALYSPTTDALSVVLVVTPMALAATGWGMYVRARRHLLRTLRERALRAEADQQLHEERARSAERTRIAREMHDILAHRISLLALHAGALEVRPDLSPAKVRESAALMRTTARQALEELRDVIGVLRDVPGDERTRSAPQPTLADIRRLADETRGTGTRVDLDMDVVGEESVPAALGRDGYRIVQEALTNIGKHANGSVASVRVTGAPRTGLTISVRNRIPEHGPSGPPLPGSGAGLLGLQERVALTGGTLVHGPDGTGDFVLEATLPW